MSAAEDRAPRAFRERLSSARNAALAALNDESGADRYPGHAGEPSRSQPRKAMSVIVASLAIHIVAASALYAFLVRALYTLLEDTPRLVVLERGLVRLLAVSVFLPPFAPTVLLVAVALWLGPARRDPRVAHLLSLGALALAADSVLRLIGVRLAQPASNVGELLDLPARFAPGPRMVAELSGYEVSGSGLVYWSVVCSFAAAAVVYVAAAAMMEGESTRLSASERRRRAARDDPTIALQHVCVSVFAFVGIAFVGQLALPVATQLFLQTFG